MKALKIKEKELRKEKEKKNTHHFEGISDSIKLLK